MMQEDDPDPERRAMSTPTRALIVIDAQQQYFDGVLAVEHPPREQSIARIAEAFDAATANGIPVVIVQHELPAGAPVFAVGSDEHRLHPEIEQRADRAAKRLSKVVASVFEGSGLAEWLRSEGVDTVTLTGYMTNNASSAPPSAQSRSVSSSRSSPTRPAPSRSRTAPAPRPQQRCTRRS
jgi:nicotinamidase-related amidase